MGQLKEVRQKQWRERARESLLSIGKKDGWNKGAPLLSPSDNGHLVWDLLESNKCGRKKSKLAAVPEESPSEVATTRSLRDVLGFTEARGEEEEEEEERGEKQKRRSNTTGGEAAGFIQLKRTTTNDDQQKDQGISGVRGENQHGETQEGVGVDPSEAVPVTRPSLSQEVALTKGEETEGEETKGEETKGEEHKETKGEENKDNGGAAERERAMIDLQSALADHVRAKYETFAMSDDATKPAQKARVIVAMVKSKISMFDTFSESPLLVRQVADLRHLLEASIGRDVWSDGSLFRIEDNLIARAGLLIDLGLVEGEDVDKLLYA